MRLRTRPSKSTPTAPPLSETEILYALLGDDAPISKMKILMLEAKDIRASEPAGTFRERYGAFLIAEAKRRGIARPYHEDPGVHAYAFEMVGEAFDKARERAARRETREWCERWGLSTKGLDDADDDDDPAA